ncbi:MAG: hypothetical protein IJ760_01890 [Bacteroidales bacterium]|nr:hypothetical protein [Bacteroidales bacterium]
MNKKVLMIAAAAMVAVAVGCGRDPEAADVAVQPVAQTKDGQPADNQLLLAVRECWQRCERAYLGDSARFEEVCSANNHAAFYSMTGISEALCSQVITLERERARVFMVNHPGYVVDSACVGCGESSLATLGGTVMSLCEAMREIETLDTTDYQPITSLPTNMTDCEIDCIYKDVNRNMTTAECLLNCLFNLSLNHAYEHLRDLRNTFTADERP